jgi:hypothetical protein
VQRAASGCSGQQPGPRPPLLGHRLPAVSVAIRGGDEEHFVTWSDEVSPGRGGKHGKSASSGGGATIIVVGVYRSEQIRWQGKWEEDLTFHRYAFTSAVLGAHHCPRKLHDDRWLGRSKAVLQRSGVFDLLAIWDNEETATSIRDCTWQSMASHVHGS